MGLSDVLYRVVEFRGIRCKNLLDIGFRGIRHHEHHPTTHRYRFNVLLRFLFSKCEAGLPRLLRQHTRGIINDENRFPGHKSGSTQRGARDAGYEEQQKQHL